MLLKPNRKSLPLRRGADKQQEFDLPSLRIDENEVAHAQYVAAMASAASGSGTGRSRSPRSTAIETAAATAAAAAAAANAPPMSQISGYKRPLTHTNSFSGDRLPTYGVETPHEQPLGGLLADIDTWGIDIFRIGDLSQTRPLTCVAYTIFQSRDLLNALMIPPRTFVAFMATLEDHYVKDNPFHNSMHAADVAQSTNVLLNTPALEGVFTPLEVGGALFAACVHDVDHPGLTNQFLINSSECVNHFWDYESAVEATGYFVLSNTK